MPFSATQPLHLTFTDNELANISLRRSDDKQCSPRNPGQAGQRVFQGVKILHGAFGYAPKLQYAVSPVCGEYILLRKNPEIGDAVDLAPEGDVVPG